MTERTKLAAAALPIVEVTVLEDRARITRRATLEATGTLELEGVATTVVDRTLVGHVLHRDASGAITRTPLGSLRVEREHLHEASALPEELAALERSAEDWQQRIASLEASLRELEAHGASIVALGKYAVGDTVLDAAYGLGDMALWRDRLAALDERAHAAREERLALEVQLEDARAEAWAVGRALTAKRQTTARERASLFLSLPAVAGHAGGGDGREEASASDRASVRVEVEISYVVANACWRPLHRAELEDGADASTGTLRLHTEGCVWQRTGEDWPGVRLVFSTERSSREAAPPPLSTDRLVVQKKSASTHVALRQEEVATTGPGMGELGGARGSPASGELPGLDDGGSTQRLRAGAPCSVRSDGRPHRARIGSFEAPAQLSLRAIPEVIPAVLRCSVQTCAAPYPLLAGPVELVRNGGFVGRTAIKPVAPGERFELGWGPEGALRLVREEEIHGGDPGLLSSQQVRVVDRTMRLSNLGPNSARLEILERIPVSELEKVKVALDPRRSHEGAVADEDGMVRLPITLEARGTATVRLGFELRAAADVTGLPF
jgi:uncharacterized protein (TIGR02231 family)